MEQRAKKHLEIALGGNMNISTLTPLALIEIMTDFAKKEVKAINYIPCCTGEAEQLSCEICGRTEEYSEDYNLCYQCWKENHIDAR